MRGFLVAYRRVLRDARLTRLLAGETVSSIGDWIYLVAILVLIYERTGDPVLLGLVGAARVAPYVVLSIPAGIVADRYDRRRILIVTDLARGQQALGLTAGRGRATVRRIAVFREMGVVEGHPTDPIGVDAVLLLQDPPHPDPRRLGVGAHRHRSALEIHGREQAEIGGERQPGQAQELLHDGVG